MKLKNNKRNRKRARTESGLHRVFVYGTLKEGRDPVYCRGALHVRPSGTGAVDFGDRELWVKGEIVLVDDAGLEELDLREGAWPEKPFYRRILIKTRSAEVCWAYEWARSFKKCELVEDGVWRWRHLRSWRGRYGVRGAKAIARNLDYCPQVNAREADVYQAALDRCCATNA